jgi:hypothetical protein
MMKSLWDFLLCPGYGHTPGSTPANTSGEKKTGIEATIFVSRPAAGATVIKA